MIVNGDSLTEHEKTLLSLGDVADLDQLRDVQALRSRQEDVGILGRYRLQKQIDAVELVARVATQAIDQAKG